MKVFPTFPTMWMRKQNLCAPAEEDGFFGENSIFCISSMFRCSPVRSGPVLEKTWFSISGLVRFLDNNWPDNVHKATNLSPSSSQAIPIYPHILHIPSYTFIYFHILPNTPIYRHIPAYTSKYSILGILGSTWNPKIAITQAPERFQRWEFDTMLPSMASEGLVHPGGLKIIKIESFTGSRGVHRGDMLYIYPINRH